MPVIAPPLTDDDALATGLDHLHGQLVVFVENTASDDAANAPLAAAEAAQRALRLASTRSRGAVR